MSPSCSYINVYDTDKLNLNNALQVNIFADIVILSTFYVGIAITDPIGIVLEIILT